MIRLIILTLCIAAACCQPAATQQATQFSISDALYSQINTATRRPDSFLHFAGSIGQGLCLNTQDTQSAIDVLSRSCLMDQCYTFSTAMRLLRKNFAGTVIDIKSPAGGQIHINFVKSIQMRLNYQLKTGGLEDRRFFYGFRRNEWSELDIVVCPRTVTVYLGCHRLFHLPMQERQCIMPHAQAQLCVGQQTDNTSTLLGDLRNIVVYEGDRTEYLCPFANIGKDALLMNISSLNQRVQLLQEELETMRNSYSHEASMHDQQRQETQKCMTNSRMLYQTAEQAREEVQRVMTDYQDTSARLVTCTQTVRNYTCHHNDEYYTIGSSWTEGCNTCRCTSNGVTCEVTPCPAQYIAGQESEQCRNGYVERKNATNSLCCDRCVEVEGGCSINNVFRSPGDSWPNPSNPLCSTCTCQNSQVSCPVRRCPATPCDRRFRYRSDSECCEQCSPVDHCEGSTQCSSRPGGYWQCKTSRDSASCECPIPFGVRNGLSCTNRLLG